MGLFDKLSRLLKGNQLAGGKTADAGAYWITVRCNRCGEVVKGRVNLNNDLSPEYDGETLTYTCRKVLIGEQRCFQQIEVWLKFDAGRKLMNREIRGGSFADEEGA
jgi:hypothetical protein